MSKRALYFIILVLLGVVGYLLFAPFDTEKADSDIRVSEPRITESEAPETENVEPTADEGDSATEATDALLGVFVGFADGKDQYLGSFKYALIDDGTEIIRADLRGVVGYDVTGLEEQLDVSVGDNVRVFGYVESGEFVAVRIE